MVHGGRNNHLLGPRGIFCSGLTSLRRIVSRRIRLRGRSLLPGYLGYRIESKDTALCRSRSRCWKMKEKEEQGESVVSAVRRSLLPRLARNDEDVFLFSKATRVRSCHLVSPSSMVRHGSLSKWKWYWGTRVDS